MPKLIAAALSALVIAGASALPAHADTGITDDSIKVGSITPISGPAAPLSIYVRQLAAYLKYESAHDGITFGDGKTRKVETFVLDSGGQPARALAAARELVEQDGVFALLSPHGTSENLAIVDYLNAKKVPQGFVNSPATIWGKNSATWPWSWGFPPDPETQVSILVAFIKSVKPGAHVALLHANDDSGKDAEATLKKLAADGAYTVAGVETYEFTDATVDSQVDHLAASNADVFINYAIGRQALQAIQKAHDIGWKPLELVETTTASSGAARKLPPEIIDGIISTAYAKDPSSPEWKDDPAIVKYYAAMAEQFGAGFDPTAQPLGAAEAVTFLRVFRDMKEPTRAAFVAAARALDNFENPFLLPGIRISVKSSGGFPITQMQIIRFDKGVPVRTGEVLSGAPLL